MINRRVFLAAGLVPWATRAAATGHLQAARELLLEFPAVDLHSHAGVLMAQGLDGWPQVEDPAAARAGAIDRMRRGHLRLVCSALVGDAKVLRIGETGITVPRPFEPGEAWRDYQRQLALLRGLSGTPGMRQVPSAREIASLADDQVGCWMTAEGADFLEGRIERLAAVHEHGIRMLQLVHYAANDLGDRQTGEAVHGGLSAFGRDVVVEANRLGLVIDVAHASFDTVRAAADLTRHPLVLSHTGLAGERWRHPRLISMEHARQVGRTGGVIGVWPSGFNNTTFEDFVDNTLALVDAVGVDHVGLGTDLDGNYRPVFSRYEQLELWVAGLLAAGLATSSVVRVMGGNALRVLSAVSG